MAARSATLRVQCRISSGSATGKASSSSSCSRATARRLGMANCPVRCGPEQRQRVAAGQAGRVQLRQRTTAHRSLLPGLYRRSVPRPAGARSGPHVVRAGYEVVGAFKDLGRPGDSRRHLRPCGVDRSGVPPFTAMTDRRPVSTSTHAASPGDNDPVFPIWVLLAVLSCPFYGVIPR
jgi:hypothetical protein